MSIATHGRRYQVAHRQGKPIVPLSCVALDLLLTGVLTSGGAKDTMERKEKGQRKIKWKGLTRLSRPARLSQDVWEFMV